MNHQRLDNVRVALRGVEPRIVAEFRGEHNHSLSSRRELRWGRKGSFALQIDGPNAGLWYDHELGRGGDILELIKVERSCSFLEALAFAQEFIGGSPLRSIPTLRLLPANHDDDKDELRRIEQALNIWSDVRPLRGTLAEKYLRSRSIEVPDETLQVLAYHSACPWDGSKHPALVALVRDLITGEPVGIHRTALKLDGSKIGRKVLGPKSGCAIKLSPEKFITDELSIGEGIESTLSGMLLGFGPAWSLIDAGGMSRFPVVFGIKRLTLPTAPVRGPRQSAGRGGLLLALRFET